MSPYLAKLDARANLNVGQGTGGQFTGTSGAFYQNNGAGGSGGNQANIIQSGLNNSIGGGAIFGSSGFAGFQSGQSGTGNVLNITQSGSGNDISVTQNGSYNGQYGYGGVINQTASTSTIAATQNGYQNDFYLIQGGSNNTITSAQVGQYGQVNIQQNNVSGGSYNVANVTQGIYGSDSNNYAAIYQQASYDTAIIAQGNGNSNSASITQVVNSALANVNQNGSNNQATVRQH